MIYLANEGAVREQGFFKQATCYLNRSQLTSSAEGCAERYCMPLQGQEVKSLHSDDLLTRDFTISLNH